MVLAEPLTRRPAGPVHNRQHGPRVAATVSPMTEPRFLTLDQVAEELATSRAQVYALLKRRDLVGIKIGGRGQWRVERSKLEEYIAQAYADTDDWLTQHPETLIAEQPED